MAFTVHRLGCRALRACQKLQPISSRSGQLLILQSEVSSVPCLSSSLNKCSSSLQDATFSTRQFERVPPTLTLTSDSNLLHNEETKPHAQLKTFDWRRDVLILDNNCTTLYVYPQWGSSHKNDTNQTVCCNIHRGNQSLEFVRRDISKEIHNSLKNVKGIHRNELDFLKSTISWCSDNSIYHSSSQSGASGSNQPDNTGKPTPGQLMEMKERLAEIMPKFFVRQADYSIYDVNIIFENNIWQKKSVGIGRYSLNLSMIRIGAHMKYTNVVLELLKITSHPEDGCIKARWRISGLPQAKSLMIWRYYPGKFRENVKKDSQWIDGISTFYLNKNGKIYKHVVDNVIPDDEVSSVAAAVDPKVAPVGLMSKTDLNNFVYTLLNPTTYDSPL